MPKLPRLNLGNRGQGPPILAHSRSTPTNYELFQTGANVTFTGGSHSLLVQRQLTHVTPAISFQGGSHTLAATHALTTVKANITWAGGSHTLTHAYPLSHTAAAIAFSGGSHAALASRRLDATAAAITFQGGMHTMTAPVREDPVVILLPSGPKPETKRYYLDHRTGRIRLTGGKHLMVVDVTGRQIAEDELLLALV